MEPNSLGDYNTWPALGIGNTEKPDGLDYDKLNQSSASLALDDMVSRIVEDDSQAVPQGFNNAHRYI